ncbi:MAG: hypothetical protein JSW00_13185 [Thermoplasmata archaeon]|nr:MAG: hypothetical protein JSW00_13185 [Thermoplasmata archaeon]
MEHGRKYKSNPYLITLLIMGTIIVIIEVVSFAMHRYRIWYFDLYGINFYYYEFLFFIILLISAQLTYLDAKKIEAGKAFPEQKTFRSMTWTPLSWGVLVFFFWILLFPAYLYMREDIYWRNISVEYDMLKTMEREITHQTQKQPPPSPKKAEYSKNVGTCPRCDTPYPIRMLERSKYCPRCGELLINE